jgi:hypothetical protein
MKHITPMRILVNAMVLVFLLLLSTGGLVPQTTPDTDGYIHPWEWESIWGTMRNPLLGYLLAPFNDNYTFLPPILLAFFFAATYYLYRKLVAFGISEHAALALTLPLIISNAVFRYAHDIHAEFPAVILSVYAIGELIALQDNARRRVWRYVAFTLALGASYILRPTFLPFIVTMPVLFLTLGFVQTKRWNIGTALVICLLSAIPFLLVSSVRYQVVKDFNTVSLGGVVMNMPAVSILDDKLISRLAPEHRNLAETMLNKREAMVKAGQLSPMAIDFFTGNFDTGKRSFRRTARSYFDILGSNCDGLWTEILLRQQKPDETWVQYNKRMMSFAVDVVRNAPIDYAMWIVGGIRSATGTAIAQNFPMVVGFIGLLATYGFLLFAKRVPPLVFPPLDIPVIILITVFFTFGSLILCLLITRPENRYVSTSALFLPSLLFYIWIQLIAAAQGDKSLRV